MSDVLRVSVVLTLTLTAVLAGLRWVTWSVDKDIREQKEFWEKFHARLEAERHELNLVHGRREICVHTGHRPDDI